jgi:hypothetical protein
MEGALDDFESFLLRFPSFPSFCVGAMVGAIVGGAVGGLFLGVKMLSLGFRFLRRPFLRLFRLFFRTPAAVNSRSNVS